MCKKKPMTQAEVDALEEKEGSLLGHRNGIQQTTWAFCWRCGGKLNVNNRNEVTNGVHNRCGSYSNHPKIALAIGDVTDFQPTVYRRFGQ